MFLIRDALSRNKGIVDSNLNDIEVSHSVDRGEEGVKETSFLIYSALDDSLVK